MAGTLSSTRILLFSLSLALPALFILPYLRVDLLPSAPDTTFQIQVQLPNTSPFGMERSVIAPLENALSAIRGVKNIRSESQYSQGSIFLEFGRKEEMDARRFEVSSILRSVYPKLPAGTSYPQLNGGNNAAQQDASPSLIYSIEGAGNAAQVRAQAEAFFRQALLQEEKVVDLVFQGGQTEQVAIEFDPQLLNVYALNVADIEQAIQQTFGNFFPGSSRDALGRTLFVRSLPREISLQSIENTFIKNQAGFPLRLRQVAKLRREWATPDHYFRINGKNAVNAYVYLAPDCNKAYEAKRIQDYLLPAIKTHKTLEIRLVEDRTQFVREELSKSWIRASASLLILLLLLLLTYRQWRLVLILVFCLVVNLAFTLLASWAFAVEWHTYTLAGLSVAFGLMIDNAIVMLDSYRRKLNRRIFLALLGATLTTAAALLLVFFLPIEQQRDLIDFAIIIVISLLTSLLSVLFLVPACYDLWVGKPAQRSTTTLSLRQGRRILSRLYVYSAGIRFLSRWRVPFYLCLALLFGFPIFMLPVETTSSAWYLQWLNSATFQRELRPHVEFWLGGTLRLFAANFNEERYYRQTEATALYIRAELPHGHTLEQMNSLIAHFERFLSQQKGIQTFNANINSGRFGDLEIRFTKAAEQSVLPLSLQTRVQELAQGFSGVQWNIFGKGEGFSNNLFMENHASARLIMRGYDYQELGRQAEKLGQELAKNMRVQHIVLDQNLNYFDRPLPEMYLNLDVAKIAERKTGVADLLGTVQQKASPRFLTFQSEKEQLQAVLRARGSEQFNVYRLLNESINTSNGSNLQLKELGNMELRQSSSTIHRENRQYLRLVAYEYVGSYDLARQLHEQVIRKMNREMPLGYSVESDQGSILEATKRQVYLLLVLLAVNFFICAILFEHLWQPFFIILTVPISFIGIFLTFAWGEFTFDQGGFAAFVMLGGIVVNASIFIINDLNNAKSRSSNFPNTLIKVLYRRSGTILLTTVSTICGFVPFLYEGPETPFWFALAVGTIGGLVMSIFAVFIVLPVLLWKKKMKA